MKKCEQCGFIVEVLPEGGGEYLCPNCGFCLRKGASSDADDAKPSPTDTTSATHLKIAKTVNVGFGDFASVLAATDASKIVASDAHGADMDRTRTATASSLNVAAPDDDDDDGLSQLSVYDEDDEYARIQADIAARVKALDIRTIELDAREQHLNKKLDEIIAEKETLRTGIEKSDQERASYLKQKTALDAQRAAMEKEFAARKASLDSRAAEIDRKTESLGKARSSLEKLKRELDISMSGDSAGGDHTSSSVSIPYSAKLLRLNSRLERTVLIQKRILICLAVLTIVLVVLLFVKESELRRNRQTPQVPAPSDPQTEEVLRSDAETIENSNHPAPENGSGGDTTIVPEAQKDSNT